MEKYKEYLDEITELSDYMADNPEVSGEEVETSAKIVDLLKSKGFSAVYPFAGLRTAFKASYGQDNHKYKAAIMVEYDALPEIGHACGHNVSAAISLLAGLVLKDYQDEIDTDIHIIGTPAEESDGAKCVMCDAGVFREYDMAMMVHLYDRSQVYCTLNGLASVMYNFHGKASHAGAAPWEGCNALNGVQLMIHGIDCIRGCSKPETRLNSIIFKGGTAGGSIPESAQVETWIRYPEYGYLQKLMERVDNCAAGAALMTECTWDKYPTAAVYKSMKRNPAGEQVIAEVFGKLGIELNGNPDELFGSSDVGNVSFECPTFHPALQLAPEGVPIHTREFLEYVKGSAARKAIEDGAKLIAMTITGIFSSEETVRRMKEDFATC